jgi:DNA polymerase elongation subunit (family B)
MEAKRRKIQQGQPILRYNMHTPTYTKEEVVRHRFTSGKKNIYAYTIVALYKGDDTKAADATHNSSTEGRVLP